jgi:AcrR family transcriptional regulator
MVRAVAADGYDAVSVRQVIELAGVSRRSFYEHFASKQDCFLATFDEIAGHHLAAARRACALTPGGAYRRLEAALGTIAGALAGDRDAGALVVLDPLAAGPPGALRLRAASAGWERLLCTSLAGTALLPAPAPASAEVMLGGMQGIVAACLRDPAPPSRRLLARELGWWALAPKLPARPADARRVASLLRDDERRASLAAANRARRTAERPRTDRERLLAAALRLGARDRVALLSAAQISDEAGVPLGAFFELFCDRDDCLRAAIADAGERLLAIAEGAPESGPDSPAALRDTLTAMLSHLAAHPFQARALTVLAPCAGPSCRGYAARLESELARRLGAGLAAQGEPAGAAVVGALWHLVRCHLADRRLRRLPSSAVHLALFALAPALGPEPAAEALLEAL